MDNKTFSQTHENDHNADIGKMEIIYRQAAIDVVLDRMNVEKHGRNAKPEEIQWALEKLPSAQPETKQGEWIPHSEMYTFPGTELTSSGGVICSSCGFRTHNRMHKLIGCPYNYCPICGTAMRKKNKNG